MSAKGFVLKSFDELVDEEIAFLKAAGVCPDMLPETFEANVLSGLNFGHGSHSYVARGLYALQLELVFRVYPREQVLVITTEDLDAHPNQTMSRVFKHLGVEDTSHLMDFSIKHNSGAVRSKIAVDNNTRLKLSNFFAPFTQALKQYIPSTGTM